MENSYRSGDLLAAGKQSIGSVFKMFPSKYVIIALAITTAGLGASTYVVSLKLDAAQSALKSEVSGRAEDKAKYEAAQAAATKVAVEAKAKKELEDVKKAAQADERTAYWRDKFNASIVRYNAATLRGKTSGPDLPSGPTVAQGSDGPSDDPGLFISMKDGETCAINTARLLSIHELATNK